ncbi:hypothetical protein B5E58_11735 [Tyzzerella sp. An114]|uniref:hypothetical protein n=1 Tax=Tyzzerella sp. An114 TaxID=1965545 RepID=UPI000B4541C2|nr:hypothetical protein [Tyzzerella sp. An114]OUQ55781.1 hypothetical protein B5E58_11735 [Tyzzerella sp. An114]
MSFNILSASGNNLTNLTNLSTDVNLSVNYTLDKNKKFIYCNYPEALKNNMFGEANANNKCLNQVVVPAGTHQIFFSYQYNNSSDAAKTPFYFGIQIFNPNSGTLSYKQLKLGHGTNYSSDKGSWAGVAGETIKDYFNSSSGNTVSIGANKSYWFEKSLPNYSGLYSGLLEFQIDKQAIVTAYIYNNKGYIDGTATIIPKTDMGGQYSGYSDGYKYVANTITLYASELQNRKKYIKLNSTNISNLKINNTTNSSDLLPIHLANPSSVTVSPTTSGQNLGNWGVIYEFPIKFVNDTSSASKTFNIYIKTETNNVNEYCIINSGTDTKYATLSGNTSGMYNSWKCISVEVASNKTDTFRYVLGTNSCAGKRLVFTVS